MEIMLYSGLSTKEGYSRINALIDNRTYADPDRVELKINYDWILAHMHHECYREIYVSYFQMLPLLELPQVSVRNADYIIYMHPYARCEDVSKYAIEEIKIADKMRKPEAEIIVVGKAANAEKLLDGSISNITFWHDHFTEKLGKKFGIDMTDKYFVYDDQANHLAIWPVNGCMQQCGFCRRTYMDIPFESLSLNTIRENLDAIRQEHPEWMKKISLRAENLTEYGIDIYGEQKLDALLDLLNSYDEIQTIEFPIGLAIGETTPRILEALCRFKDICLIALNLEAGSDRLLQVIGKKHTRERAIQVCKTIRKAHPQVIMYTTVMVGLPTEQLTDIYDLASLVGETEMDHVLCNYYIDNPKQPLAKLPQLSESLREYHLKIFCKELCHTLKRECHLTSYKIYKSKKSRRYARDMEYLRKYNERNTFPAHKEQRFVYTKESEENE